MSRILHTISKPIARVLAIYRDVTKTTQPEFGDGDECLAIVLDKVKDDKDDGIVSNVQQICSILDGNGCITHVRNGSNCVNHNVGQDEQRPHIYCSTIKR